MDLKASVLSAGYPIGLELVGSPPIGASGESVILGLQGSSPVLCTVDSSAPAAVLKCSADMSSGSLPTSKGAIAFDSTGARCVVASGSLVYTFTGSVTTAKGIRLGDGIYQAESSGAAVSPTGGFVLVGSVGAQAYLGFFDADGKPKTQVVFGPDATTGRGLAATAVALAPDGGALVAGRLGGGGTPTVAWAAKFDPTGKFVWQRQFVSVDKSSVSADRIIATRGGATLVAGTITGSSFGPVFGALLDGETGDVAALRQIGDVFHTAQFGQVIGLEELPNVGFALAARVAGIGLATFTIITDSALSLPTPCTDLGSSFTSTSVPSVGPGAIAPSATSFATIPFALTPTAFTPQFINATVTATAATNAVLQNVCGR
jgi:hypothetical protein